MVNHTLPDSDKDKLVSPSESDQLFHDVYGDDIAELDKLENPDAPKKDGGIPTEEAAPAGDWTSRVGQGGPGKSKKSTGDRAKQVIKVLTSKGGIAGLIGTGLGGGLIAAIIFGAPFNLFVQMGTIFTNADDMSSPALKLRFNKNLRVKMDAIRNGFAESSTGKCNIKCQFGSVTDAMKRNLESRNNGFKAEFVEKNTPLGKRYLIKSITFPSGETVRTGAEWAAAMAKVQNAKDFKSVFNSRIKFWLNGSKLSSMLRIKFPGLDRLAKAKGTTKEKIVESQRKAVGAEGKDAKSGGTATAEANKAKVGGKVNARISGAAGGVTNVVGLACAAYDVSRVSLAATKFAKMATFAAFALTFLSIKDQIMAGDAQPEVVSTLGAQLTDNGSATDAAAYKQAAYGDNIASNSKFTLNPSSDLLGSMALVTGWVGVSAVSRAFAHTTCVTGYAAAYALCATSFLAGLAEAVVGSVINLAACVALNVGSAVAASELIGLLLPGLIATIVKADLIVPDETTRGIDAGEVIGLGAIAVMNGKSATYGLSPATSKDDILAYQKSTIEVDQQDAAIARLEASDKPFDVNNQYSFVGSLATKLNLASYKSSSVLGNISRTLGLIPQSFSALSTATSAEGSFPLGYDKSSLYSSGNNPSLDAIGVVSNKLGMETYVMSEKEMNADPIANIDAMVAKKQIDLDTGDAIPGSDYEKYTKYCGIERTDPLGETTESINDDDYEWKIGAECGKKSGLMSNIRVYTMDRAIQDTIEEKDANDGSQDLKAVLPVDPGYKISVGDGDFGPRIAPCSGCSSNHPAVDFQKPLGSPVYSIMDGEVIAVTNDGIDNPVSIKHADESVSQYLHMYSKDITVKVGQTVKAGQRIGKVGQSGNATGPHLDLRIYIDKVNLDQYPKIEKITTTPANVIKHGVHTYINPAPFLKNYGLTI